MAQPPSCQQIKLVQIDGWWYSISSLTITIDTDTISIIANHNVVSDETAPVLSVDANGEVSAKKDSTLGIQSREWLDSMFQTYRQFTEDTGTLVMVQEFGFNETINYQATLAAAEDFLSVLDAYDIPWCSWYGNFGPVLDKRDDAWYALWPWGWQSKRVGAEYKLVSDNWMIDTGLMEVYQKYMN